MLQFSIVPYVSTKKKKAKNTKSCNVIVVVFLNYPNDVFRVKIHFSDIKAYKVKIESYNTEFTNSNCLVENS